MARTGTPATLPLVGMLLVAVAMALIAAAAYYDNGWYSIIGYALAAIVAILGFTFTFRDRS